MTSTGSPSSSSMPARSRTRSRSGSGSTWRPIGTLRGVARRLQVWILGSLFERDPEISGRFYNAAVLLDPRGEIMGRYRKSYIPYRAQNTERYYFTPGNLRFPVFQVEDLTIGV